MVCTKCSNQLSDIATVCDKCGQSVIAQAPSQQPSSASAMVLAPATILRRLSNYILDSILTTLLILAVVLYYAFSKQDPSSLFGLGIVIPVFYYVIFESLWQVTPGKFLTKTKVVMRDGTKPPFMNIVGRTFARVIPFEAFSYLFGSYPVGWHDSLSGTLVVPSSYSESDVRGIDLNRVKKEKGHSGVLLIVLIPIIFLVAIAIVGVLSSVVLVSLNVARQKGQDAKVQADIMQIRPAAEVYYADNNSYSTTSSCDAGMFADDRVEVILDTLKVNGVTCYAEDQTYAVSVRSNPPKLMGTNYCVDSTGYRGVGKASVTDKKASCVPVEENQPLQ